MSSDEEYDYMSEKFLTESVTQDVRPGLIFNRTQKRDHEIHKKRAKMNEENKKRFRPSREVESERREEGLSQALDSSNKGFALLQKMGYKSGSAIGKTGEGRVEPITIEIKSNRGGLGRETALKEIAVRKKQLRKQILQRREQLTNVESYRSRLAQQQAEKFMEGDLHKSQKACHELDLGKDIDSPHEIWFWPKSKDDDKEEEEETETLSKLNKEEDQTVEDEDEEENDESTVEFETREKLEIITLYLRKVHLYCIWCGIKYENETDLAENCPGQTRDDH